MAFNLKEIEPLVGKRVSVVYTIDGETEAVEVEAVLQAASEVGVMFRPRNSQSGQLIAADHVESVLAIAAAPRPLKQKLLKAIGLDDARGHLAERHNYTLTSASEMLPAVALLTHDQIDHTDLGHSHEGK